MIRRIVQGREGMASASSYDMAGNGIEQQLGMWRPPVSGIVKTFDAQLGGLYFLGFLWFCPQCRLLLAGYVPLYANGHPFESPARHLSIYSLSSPPPKHQASLIAAAHIIFFLPCLSVVRNLQQAAQLTENACCLLRPLQMQVTIGISCLFALLCHGTIFLK